MQRLNQVLMNTLMHNHVKKIGKIIALTYHYLHQSMNIPFATNLKMTKLIKFWLINLFGQKYRELHHLLKNSTELKRKT